MGQAVDKITYRDMVTKFGETRAFDLLLTVERLAKINENIAQTDEEVRFQTALDALNEINFAL